MATWKSFKPIIGALALCACIMILTTACGSQSSATSGPTTAKATSTACPQVNIKTANGTLQSVNGSTLQIKESNGSSVNAVYTSSTRFTRQELVSSSALKEGTVITVLVKQNTDGTYTATTINLTNGNGQGFRGPGGTGQRQGQNGAQRPQNANCFTGRRGNGNAGGFGGNAGGANGANGNAQALRGTVGQLNGSTLTVADTTGSDYTVTITNTTRIIQTASATASDLKSGANVTLFGTTNTQGVLQAQSVTILAAGSTQATGTPA